MNVTANSSTIDIFKYPLVEGAYLTTVIVGGTVGNILIMGALSTDKKLRRIGTMNYFVFNLAIADIFVTGFVLPTILASVVNGYTNVFASAMVFCHMIGYTATIFCNTSMQTLMFIALIRYWKITRSATFDKWFSKRKTIAMCIYCWIQAALVALPEITGWFGSGILLDFDPYVAMCLWDDHNEKSKAYNFVMIGSAVGLPLVLLLFFYIQIFRFVMKSRKRIKQRRRQLPSACLKMNEISYSRQTAASGTSTFLSNSTETGASETKSKTKVKTKWKTSIKDRRSLSSHAMNQCERQMVTMMLAVVVAYLICLGPYPTLSLINPQANALVKRALIYLGLTNSALNSIIYGAMNKNFRDGYKRFINKTLCCLFPFS